MSRSLHQKRNAFKLNISKSPRLKTGDFVNFGKYLGDPILWRVINIDTNGILILSERILCLKAFDSAESGKCSDEEDDEDNFLEESREKDGSNNWQRN